MNLQELRKSIKGINDTFVRALLDGRYIAQHLYPEVVQCTMESGHNFYLWIGNGPEWFKCYEYMNNFMELDFTQNQKEVLHERFNNENRVILAQKNLEEAQKAYDLIMSENGVGK